MRAFCFSHFIFLILPAATTLTFTAIVHSQFL
jgi:hypothetical protein